MRKPALHEKDVLTPEEVIEYFNFSRRKWYSFLNEGKCKKFTALYGVRKLILREEFEKYLNDNPGVKEALANGRKGRPQTRFKA